VQAADILPLSALNLQGSATDFPGYQPSEEEVFDRDAYHGVSLGSIYLLIQLI
jgi:hypothetical protein